MIINDNGVVTKTDKKADGIVLHPYTVTGKDGKQTTANTQFHFNDPKMDANQLANFEIGDQAIRF